MEPFTWAKGTVVRTRNPNAAINVVIRNSHTVIHGLKTMEVIQIKYALQTRYPQHIIRARCQIKLKTISIIFISEDLVLIQGIRSLK